MAKVKYFEPRSINTFGVVGLLEEDCKIYYDTLFSMKHLGRVSDLLCAKLKGSSPNELKFRTLLLFSLFEAYRTQIETLKKKPGDKLEEPVVVECGIDKGWLAIGVSFAVPDSEPLDTKTIEARIDGEKPETFLEQTLVELQKDADHLVLRVHQKIRRVEIVSMLSVTGTPYRDGAHKKSFEVVQLETQSAPRTLKGQYVELGDLNYQELLQNDYPSLKTEALKEEEVSENSTGELAELVRLRGESQTQDSTIIRVAGGPQTAEHVQTVSGGSVQSPENIVAEKQAQLHQERMSQMQNRIEELERLLDHEKSKVTSLAPQDSQTGGSSSRSFREIIEQVWPFKKTETALSNTTSNLAAQTKQVPAPAAPVSVDLITDAPAAQEEILDGTADSAQKLVKDQVGSFDRTIAKVQKDAIIIKSDLPNPKAQKWVDGMVGELVAEKARVHDMSKKLNASIRQKEVEFRNKEHALQEEVRKRDEQIRQRNSAFFRARDQIAQMAAQLEKAKTNPQSSPEDIQMRQKFAMNQKLLTVAKDENQTLTKKLEDMKNQLTTVQAGAKNKATNDELVSLRTKYDRVFKHCEELKKRVEVSVGVTASYQKDAEILKLRVDELQREEGRLKQELNRAASALRMIHKAKASPSGGSSGESGSGSSAA